MIDIYTEKEIQYSDIVTGSKGKGYNAWWSKEYEV